MKKLWSIILGILVVSLLITCLFRLDDVLLLVNDLTGPYEESNEITEEILEEEPKEELEEELEELPEEENSEEIKEELN